MLDAESEEICTFRGNWSKEELQHAFDKIKFANRSVNAVSKEHGIPRRTLRDYLIFSSIKTFYFQRLALLPTERRYYLQGGVITYLPLALLPSRAFNNANCNDFTF